MAITVKEYIRACSICQQVRYNNQPPAGLLQPLPIPNQIWQNIAMDFITSLPLSHGYSVILVIIDCLSKFAHFLPLTTDFSTPKVADVFIKEIVSIHGLSQTIVSDCDKVFTSKFWEQICARKGIKLARNSAYHPQSDGQTEVLNRCLETYLNCYTQAKPKD